MSTSSSRNPLKFTVEGVTNVQLYPESDEPVNILNIKRGIISALVVPVMEDEQNSFMVSIFSQPKVASSHMNRDGKHIRVFYTSKCTVTLSFTTKIMCVKMYFDKSMLILFLWEQKSVYKHSNSDIPGGTDKNMKLIITLYKYNPFTVYCLSYLILLTIVKVPRSG